MRMCEHLDVVARTNEQAKIFGIDFQSVLFRGSQYRVESMMLRLAHRDNCTYISIYMTDTFRSHAQVRSVRVARFEKTRRQIHTRNRLALGTGRTLRFPEL